MTKRRFLPAENVRWAKILKAQPPWIHRKKSKGRFAVGVRYESKAQEALELAALGIPNLRYIRSPWIEFEDNAGKRWCQADALLLQNDLKQVLIYEIKYRHCLEAWWQLTYLYEPVVKALFPGYLTARMEICHWFDPGVAFPQGYDLTKSPLLVPKRNRVAVCIFNPGRRSGLPGAGQGRGESGDKASSSQGSAESSQRSAGSPGPCSGILV